MNILFITPSLPNRLKRTRAFCLIKALARRHQVHLVSLSHSSADDSFKEIASLCASVTVVKKSLIRSVFDCVLAIPSGTPFEVAYCKSKELENAVAELVARLNIDLVYVKRLRCAQYAENVNVKKVLDTTDAMSLFYARSTAKTKGIIKFFNKMEGLRYASYEKYLGQKYSNWITCSEVDKKYLKEKVTGVDISVIPNGVDTMYHFADPRNYPEPYTIMVSGLMDKLVNIEAALYLAKEIFPLILEKIPQAKLLIVGPNPVKAVKDLVNENVIVTGYVEDIRPYIDRSTVIACPVLTGTGTRNKILQAWAHKKPVVTTTQGLEGLPGIHGTHCMVADTKEEFAGRVIQLMNSREVSAELGQNGFELVEKNFSIDSMEKGLTDLFGKLGGGN